MVFVFVLKPPHGYYVPEKVLQREKGKNKEKDNSLIFFSGKDIDGLKWDVYAVAARSYNQWYVSCEFINGCHKAGKFISCDDFAK